MPLKSGLTIKMNHSILFISLAVSCLTFVIVSFITFTVAWLPVLVEACLTLAEEAAVGVGAGLAPAPTVVLADHTLVYVYTTQLTLRRGHYNHALDKWLICSTKWSFVSKDLQLCVSKYTLILSLVNWLWILMAQSQIICDASAMGKTRIIRTKSWNRSHDFAPVGGALRTPAACRKFFRHRHTRRGRNLWN